MSLEADSVLAQRLLENYVYQKELLLEEAGVPGRLDRDRLMTLARPRMEQLAEIVENWDVPPDVLMAAVFALAKRNRHPDGPMPNMLTSVKYLSKALSSHLQMPFEAVQAAKSMAEWFKREDYHYEVFKKEMGEVGVTDMTTAGSYPVEWRYAAALEQMDWSALFYMAPEVLERMAADKRTHAWMNHQGIKYEAIAAFFNRNKK